MSVRDNLQHVRHIITSAAGKAGRRPEDIILVAATKNRSVKETKEAIAQGVNDIGENRAQELTPKFEAIGRAARWHFIGPLQRNKVVKVVPLVNLIQSVDRMSLAKEIDKRAAAIGKRQAVLLEVNMSSEPSKLGFAPSDMESAFEQVTRLANISVKGIMTMAPLVDDAEKTRPVFADAKELFDRLAKQTEGMEILSMGMTNDYHIAIEEGSNMIRIGTGIFGAREKE